MNWYKIAELGRVKNRDLWGGSGQGDEGRNSFESQIEEYDLFENEHREEIKKLKDYYVEGLKGNWEPYNNYNKELEGLYMKQEKGLKILERLRTASMYKVKIPQRR